MKYTFKKDERLCSKLLINKLFTEGESFLVYPFKVVCLNIPRTGSIAAQILISVSKRNFKSAPHRNKIKRHIREAYRKNKHIIWDDYKDKPNDQLLAGFVYIGKSIATSKEVDQKLILILQRLIEMDVKNTR